MPSAIAGTFADFKIIKTRSVLQIVVEIPIEQGQAALELLGIPQPGAEIPVAIARLIAPPKVVVDHDKSSRAKEIYATKDSMEKAVTRAAILCEDREFMGWLTHCLGRRIDSPVAAAEELRRMVGVNSRSQIGASGVAYNEFLKLETTFRQAIGQMAEAR